MTEEIKTEATKLFESIVAAEPFNLGDQKEFAELLRSCRPLRAALRAILVVSDEKLMTVARSNLGDGEAVKTIIKMQGEAIGLSDAVEYIIDLATKEKENV